MRKLRWLRVHSSLTIESIKNKINQFKYSETLGEGFVINRIRKHQIEAIFIEKIESVETIRTPSENVITQKYINYYKTPFTWNAQSSFIEIYQPSRRCGYFLNKLCETCDFDLATEDYKPNTLLWLNRLEELLQINLLVTQIRIDKIHLDTESFADVLIRGMNDVRSKIKLITKTKNVMPRKISAKYIHDNKTFTVILHDNGIAEFSENISDLIKNHISNALQLCTNNDKS